MTYNMNYITTSTIAQLDMALNELQTAKQTTDTYLAWIDATNLVFYDLKDKDKKYPKNLDTILNELKNELGHRITANEAEEILNFFKNEKQDYKDKKVTETNLKVVSGPKYTKEALSYERKKIVLRDELLRINSLDTNLYQNFKMCGGQLVLVENNETELLTEDTQGRVTIPNELFLKGKLADRVQQTFMTKLSMYYKKFAEFLSKFDVDDIDVDSSNGIIETPIEDYIQTELPTSFIKYYGVEAVYKTWEDNKNKKHKMLDHFELIRNQKIECWDEIFNYTIENWKKFKRCIQGQEKFLAWSNDSKEISVSHWITENITKMPKPWEDFINQKMNTHFASRLITYLGMCMDATNTTQQYLIISDEGGTGKGVMMRALEYALPKGSISSIDGNLLEDKNEFGLAGIKIWNTHISVMEEYNTNSLQSNKSKKMIANNPMDLNVKGKNFIHWEPINHKMIVFSNHGAVIKEFANRRRAIPITFTGKYVYDELKHNELKESAKDFLNYCYTVYKKNPMYINSHYLVLSEEDEKDYINGTLVETDEDILSKRAFNEENLRDFFTTDEYSNTDEYCDYENVFNELFEVDVNEKVTIKDMSNKILDYCTMNKEYMESFGIIKQKDEYQISLHSKEWWKWSQFLDGKNIKIKNLRENNLVYRYRIGIKFKTINLQTQNNVDNNVNDDTDDVADFFVNRLTKNDEPTVDIEL